MDTDTAPGDGRDTRSSATGPGATVPQPGSDATAPPSASNATIGDDAGEDASVWEEYEYEADAGAGEGAAHQGVYYYNHTTGVSQYEEPACLKGVPHQLYHPPDGPAWHAYVDESGFVYFYNHDTQASQYEEPAEDYVPLRVAYSTAVGSGQAVLQPGGSPAAVTVTSTPAPQRRGDADNATARADGDNTPGRGRSKKKLAKKKKRKRKHRRDGRRSGDAGGAVQPAPVTAVGDGPDSDVHGSQGVPAQHAGVADGDTDMAAAASDTESDWSSSGSSTGRHDDAAQQWLPGLGPDAPPERVFTAFRWQSVCHAVACEAPALVVESTARSAAMLLGSLVLAVLAALRASDRPARLRLAACWLREAIIFAFSVPSFVLPGLLACSVYVPCTRCARAMWLPRDMRVVSHARRYQQLDNAGDDWDMSPLWTLIGDVDPRRFWIIRRGNGSYARNGRGIVFQPSGVYAARVGTYCSPCGRLTHVSCVTTRPMHRVPPEYSMDGVWGRHLGSPAGHTAIAGGAAAGGADASVSGDEEFGLASDEESPRPQRGNRSGTSKPRTSRQGANGRPRNGVRNGVHTKQRGSPQRVDSAALVSGHADLSVIDIGGQSFSMSMASIDLGLADGIEGARDGER